MTIPDADGHDAVPVSDARPGEPAPDGHLVRGGAWVLAAVLAAWAAHALVPAVSLLVAAVAVGAVAANVRPPGRETQLGVGRISRRLLRVGVALLGFRLSIGDVLSLGPGGLAVVVLGVWSTFVGTIWLGRRLGVGRDLALLTASGFSICGASAVAAVNGVIEADEQDAAYAIALVTLCGSLCIAALPVLGDLLGLSDDRFGLWVGASVHDVGQVVATASVRGRAAVDVAVVVKLTRVAMLAPVVAVSTFMRGRRSEAVGAGGPTTLVPAFVGAFLAAVVVRSTGVVPDGVLAVVNTVQNVLLAGALAGLGAGVRLAAMRRIGGRPLVLGLASWLLIAVVSLVGVVAVT